MNAASLYEVSAESLDGLSSSEKVAELDLNALKSKYAPANTSF